MVLAPHDPRAIRARSGYAVRNLGGDCDTVVGAARKTINQTNKMKLILATLISSTALAGATTITINQNSPGLLDFSVEWGQTLSQYGAYATGSDGSSVSWIGQPGRDRNTYFIEIHEDNLPVSGIYLHLGPFTESYGQTQTAFGTSNVWWTSDSSVPMTALPLPGDPYGARFVCGSAVPDTGGTVGLLALGLAGMCWVGRRV